MAVASKKSVPGAWGVFLLMGSLCAGATWLAYKTEWHPFLVGFSGLIGAAVLASVIELRGAINNKREINQRMRDARTPGIFLGSGHVATGEELDPFRTNDDGRMVIGSEGPRALFYGPWESNNGSCTAIAPARTGKTVSICINLILKLAGFATILCTDVKTELVQTTMRYARERCGNDNVYLMNPTGLYGLPDAALNVLAPIRNDLKHNEGRESSALLKEFTTQLCPETPGPQSDGNYFKQQAEKVLQAGILEAGLFAPEETNLVGIYQRMFASKSEQENMARRLANVGGFGNLPRDRGQAWLELLQAGMEKTYVPVLNEAQEAVYIYDAASGHWSQSLQREDFSFDDILYTPSVVYMTLPLDKLKEYAPWQSLVSNLFIKTVSRARKTPIPLCLLLEEAGNLPKIDALHQALTLLPGQNLRLYTIWQAYQQIATIYGKEFQSMLVNESLLHAWSISDPVLAEMFSKWIGEETIVTESYNDHGREFDPYTRTFNKARRRVLTPDEILRLPNNEQLVRTRRGVVHCQRKAYWEIDPFVHQCDENPFAPSPGFPDPVSVWL